MANVRVLFHSVLSELTGARTLEHNIGESGTVQDLLETFSERYGEEFKDRVFDPKTGGLRRFIIVTVNGRDIRHLNRLETGLRNGDEVAILPVVAGG